MTVLIAPSRPYKGLRPFEDSALDALLFFGRDRERELIEANLIAARLTVLYGASGVGKSSVLRAGVVHSLREQARAGAGFVVVLYANWSAEDPLAGIVQVAREAVADVTGFEAGPEEGTLGETLHALGEVVGGDLYLVLDQFDEYFLYHGADGGPLLDELPTVVTTPGVRVNTLLGVREDALARLDVFKGRIPGLFGNYLRLERLSREAGRDAIVGPLSEWAQLAGEDMTIEPALVEVILESVTVGKIEGNGAAAAALAHGVEPPYLQVVLERLWDAEREQRSQVLRLETLERLGGARRIVAEHLDRALAALDAAGRDTAAAMFAHLVTPSGAKVAHEVADLAGYADADEAAAREVVDTLLQERILRPVEGPQADGGRVEIFHDVLAAAVADWRRRHDAERRLAAERADARRRHRRVLVVAVVAVIALAAMTAVAAYALVQQREADDQRAAASSQAARALAASALAILPHNPVRGLRLAVSAAAVTQTPAIEDALREALLRSPQRAIYGRGRETIMAAAFSSLDERVVVGDETGRVTIARSEGGVVVAFRHPGLRVLSLSDDGHLLVTAGGHSAIVRRLPGAGKAFSFPHRAIVNDAAFEPGGLRLVTAAADAGVRIWGLRTGLPIARLPFPGEPRHLSFNPAGTILLVSGDGRALAYDLDRRKVVSDLPGGGAVNIARFSPAGGLVAAGYADGEARVYEVPGRPESVFSFPGHRQHVTDVAFSGDGAHFVTASTDGTARVWDLMTGQLVSPLSGHLRRVNSVAFSPDSQYVVTASADETAMVWKVNGQSVATLRGHADSVDGASFSPDGRTVLTWSRDGTARLWDYQLDPEVELTGMVPAAKTVFVAPDGAAAAVVDAAGNAYRADLRSRRFPRLPHPGRVRTAVMGPSGRVLTGGEDGTARLWATDGRPLQSFEHGGKVRAVAISADGSLVVTGGPDQRARLFDADGKAVRTIEPSSGGAITAAAASDDGTRVALGDARGLVTVWNATTGQQEARLEGHTNDVYSIDFNGDATRLVTGSLDHNGRLWTVATGASQLLSFADARVRDASFSPDGRWIVTAGSKRVALWRTRTGERILALQGHRGKLLASTFSPDGRWIRTADTSGEVGRYRCEICGGIDELRALAEWRLRRLTSGS